MADYAIDIVAPAPEVIAHGLVAYAETDTLCYRADPDEPLHARQLEVWEPLLAAFEAEHGTALVRVSGVLHRPQPAQALAVLHARLVALDTFALAGVDAMTKLAASLVTALAALDARGEEEPAGCRRPVVGSSLSPGADCSAPGEKAKVGGGCCQAHA